jgi:hypothetical protein
LHLKALAEIAALRQVTPRPGACNNAKPVEANLVYASFVEHEVRLAHKLEQETRHDVLCPVALDDGWKACRWSERLREQIEEYNVLDFSGWDDRASLDRMYRRLIQGLDLFYRREGAADESTTLQ